MQNLKIKFDGNQDYQIEAVKSIVDIFEGQTSGKMDFEISTRTNTLHKNELGIGNNLELDEKEILKNVQKIQLHNGISKSNILQGMNFTIEMETGTGKTYVYLRTILELYKNYGFTKYIVVVPSIAIKEGVIRAKIRCTGNAHHAFWLGSEGKLPHVNIFHFDGKKIQVGNANKTVFDSAVVTGINASDFYIYTLMWNKKELIWMINDVEIYRTSSNVPNEEMFLTLNSFIPEKSHGGAGSLEVDWIRVYAN